MPIILRSVIGDQVTSNFHLDGENRLHIHLIATDKGFEWKITRSKLIQEGPINKWKGDGKGFIFVLGDIEPETRKEFDEFLTEAGVNGELREKFSEKMSFVRDRATLKWGVGYSGKERK